jgi:hypothetical protein
MVRPPEFLKSFADRIARAANSDAADQLVRMLTISGLTGENRAMGRASEIPRTFYASEPGVPPRQSRNIGIWERKIENGKTCFVRPMQTIDSWHFWANVGRIEPKGAKLRVLLIGESVARGYLYDPSFTPAMALQMILEEQWGTDRVEVIDLARTNLGYEVRELALAALQLRPDAAIIFSGNNWGFSLPAFDDIADIDQAIATKGMAGVKRVCDRYIARAVKTIVGEIAAEYKSSGVPLTWVIPEFNLADWREPFTNAPYLPDNRNREWIAAVKEARQAFSEGDFVRAEQLAARVVELDQGTCAAGYYILADCRRLANDTAAQRKYLELARDAQSWDSSVAFIPKPYAIAQQILREELPQYDVQLVDLPAVFKQYLNGELPGVRLFLDYCHLTGEGIRIAMGSAASCVLRALKGVEQPWHTLVKDDVAPSREIEAEACFLAAIHGAHLHQRYDLVHHWCARALEYSAHVGEIMLNYIDLQLLNKAPLRMSEAERQIFRLGSPLVHRYLFQRNNEKWLDKILLTAAVEALEEAGVPARDRREQLFREEHSTRRGEVNLLHPFYQQSAGQPHEFEASSRMLERVDQDPHYFRAYWPESKFVFIGEAGYPVSLSLTCRLPKLSLDEGTISVACNGDCLAETTIGQEWSAWEITVPREMIRDGLNEIEVRWPIPEFRTGEALSEVVVKLCQQKYPEYYPTFGEIHSFTASDACPVSITLPLAQAESPLAQVA